MNPQLTPYFDISEQKKFLRSVEKRQYKNSFGFTPQDIANSKLKLCFLKENPNYQKKYLKLKESNAAEEGIVFLKYLSERFGTNHEFLKQAQMFMVPANDIVNLLDPSVDVGAITDVKLINMLPKLFISKGVKEIFKAQKLARMGENVDDSWRLLKPAERLLKINLRKRKIELVEEFKNYIERELSIQNAAKTTWEIDPPISYLLWEPQNSRQRTEGWGQLKIWQMRKECRSFFEIAASLKLKDDTVKKRFYKAYERIYGTPYDKDKFKDAVIKYFERKIITTTNTDQKTKLIEKLLKMEEGGQTEYLPRSKRPQKDDEIGGFETDPGSISLLYDIERAFCINCIDKSCKSIFFGIMKGEEDPKRWDPCPKVLKFLQPQ